MVCNTITVINEYDVTADRRDFKILATLVTGPQLEDGVVDTLRCIGLLHDHSQSEGRVNVNALILIVPHRHPGRRCQRPIVVAESKVFLNVYWVCHYFRSEGNQPDFLASAMRMTS